MWDYWTWDYWTCDVLLSVGLLVIQIATDLNLADREGKLPTVAVNSN